MGPSWAIEGPSEAALDPSGGFVGQIRGSFGIVLCRLRALAGRSEVNLKASWVILGPARAAAFVVVVAVGRRRRRLEEEWDC